ncbi:proton channel OtopLc-like isoform X2 [Vespula maculifrons]|uniref:Proton channel OtopLc-like isoform X2 n=1 Tax=Vespula maculifrons TaxID=7453 RepID=A0ABD2B3V0_VESMC
MKRDGWGDRQRTTNDSEEMQRCPYLHEMKERLLSQPTPTDSLDMERLDGGTPVKEANLHNDYPAHTNPGVIPDPPEMPPDSLIGTVVKLNSDGYGSHTSPAHARQPLVPQNANNQPLCLTPTHTGPSNGMLPKNAKSTLLLLLISDSKRTKKRTDVF